MLRSAGAVRSSFGLGSLQGKLISSGKPQNSLWESLFAVTRVIIRLCPEDTLPYCLHLTQHTHLTPIFTHCRHWALMPSFLMRMVRTWAHRPNWLRECAACLRMQRNRGQKAHGVAHTRLKKKKAKGRKKKKRQKTLSWVKCHIRYKWEN